MPEFIPAKTMEDYREAAALLREYEAGLGIDLCFQGFSEELESLERMYGPPGGRFLIVRQGERTAGCVALRDLGGGICEMKRLFVRPDFRGRGLGRKCAEEIVCAAREMGYASVRLDTLPSMRAAHGPVPLDWVSGKFPLTPKIRWRGWFSWSWGWGRNDRVMQGFVGGGSSLSGRNRLHGTAPRIYAYMDAPPECKRFLRRVRRKAVRLSRTFGPLRCGASSWPRARMEMRGSGPNRPGELSGSSHIPGCPDPVSRTVCPYPSSGLPTFLPALSVRPLLRREAPVPCRPPCSASAPRRCARSYWPAPPRRASSACAPTSGRATNPAAHLAGQPSAPPTSHP